MNASFNDDLYGGSEVLTGGTGLIAFCRESAGYCYERHDSSCKPGLWRVCVFAARWDDMVEEFHEVLSSANAVVDDFGNLRRVQ